VKKHNHGRHVVESYATLQLFQPSVGRGAVAVSDMDQSLRRCAQRTKILPATFLCPTTYATF